MERDSGDPPDIRKAYDRWSATYDTVENRTRDLDARLLRRLAPPLAGKTVIEVGCGTGKNSIWLARRCQRVIALDFSGRMLAGAQAKLAAAGVRVELVCCDVSRPWPLLAGLADLVLINLVLEHLPTLDPVLAEVGRSLRPGGEAYISEFHPARILAGEGARFESETGVEHVGSYAHLPDALRAAAARAGLEVVEMAAWDDDEERHPAMAAEDPLPRLLTTRLLKTDQ